MNVKLKIAVAVIAGLALIAFKRVITSQTCKAQDGSVESDEDENAVNHTKKIDRSRDDVSDIVALQYPSSLDTASDKMATNYDLNLNKNIPYHHKV